MLKGLTLLKKRKESLKFGLLSFSLRIYFFALKFFSSNKYTDEKVTVELGLGWGREKKEDISLNFMLLCTFCSSVTRLARRNYLTNWM